MERTNIVPERRFVTVLFGDIKGFTTLSEYLDPEDVEDIINEIFTIFRKIIEENGGYVDKFIGDAVMAVFGAPRMHEDDARRAVISAIEMQKVLKEINNKRNMNLFMRIGINTGNALWSSIAGEKPTVMGDAVNVAQRLESICEPGKIFVSEKVEQLAGKYFYFKDRGEVKVKGRSEALKVFEVLGEKTPFSEFLIRGRIKTPFLEREKEIEKLKEHLKESISEGNARFVLIKGEAGIGKSRLSYEFIEKAKKEFSQVKEFIVHSDPLRSGAFLPVVQILRMQLEVALKEHSYVIKEIEDLLSKTGKYSHTEISTFKKIIDELLYPRESGREFHDEARIFRERLSALKAVFEAIFSKDFGSYILVFDDFHRADVDTRKFIEYLTASPPEVPILFLIASREDLESMDNISIIELRPLSKLSLFQIVKTIFDVEQEDIHEEFVDFIINKTAGNPYYMEELLLYLKDRDLVQYNPLRISGEGIFVPETLQGILVEKVDTLPQDMKKVIKYAACIGKVFWKKVLEEVLEKETGNILTELELEGLIFREPHSAIEGDIEYAFKHELLRESTYSLLTRRERETIHRKIGEVLESRAKNESILFNAAYHYKHGREEEKASKLFEKAGDIAFDKGYFSFALNCYECAGRSPVLILKKAHTLENLSFYKEGEELLRQHIEFIREREDLYFQYKIRLASLLEKQAKFDEALEELEEACTSHRADIKSEALYKRAWILFKKAKYKESLEWAKSSLTIIEKELEVRTYEKELIRRKGSVYNLIASIYHRQGNYKEALEHYTNAKSLFEKINRKSSVASVLTNISQVYMYTGDFERAGEVLIKALELAKDTGNRFLVAAILNNLSMVQMQEDRYEEALKNAEESLKIVTNLGNKHAAIHILINIGRLYLNLDKSEQALKSLKQALDLSRDIEYKWGIATSMGNIGFAHIKEKDYEKAEKYLADSIEISRQLGDRYGVASALKPFAEIMIHKKEYQRALNILEEALEIFESLNNKIGAASVRVDLASVHFIIGEWKKVREILQEIVEEDIREMDVEDVVKYALMRLVVDGEDVLNKILQKERIKSTKEIVFAFDVREYMQKKDREILERLKNQSREFDNPFYYKIVEKLSSV